LLYQEGLQYLLEWKIEQAIDCFEQVSKKEAWFQAFIWLHWIYSHALPNTEDNANKIASYAYNIRKHEHRFSYRAMHNWGLGCSGQVKIDT
jgi:hypothetical protein